jgi:hypothetical protein
MGTGSELRHNGECPDCGYEDVSHRNIVTAGAAHPHDVPGVDHLTAVTGEIHHHQLRLTLTLWPSLVSSYHRRRGNPVSVMTVANKRRAPINVIPALGRDRLHWASKLRCDHNICAATVDLLGALIWQAGAEVRPV